MSRYVLYEWVLWVMVEKNIKINIISSLFSYIAVGLTAIMIPLELCFSNGFIAKDHMYLDLIISTVIGIDIFVQKKFQKNPHGYGWFSSKKNKSSSRMLIQYLGIIPFDVVAYTLSSYTGLTVITNLRYLKAIRIFKPIPFISKNPLIPQAFKAFSFAWLWLIAVHWIACGWILVNGTTQQGASAYIDALYWAVTTLTTIGYGDITPTSSIGKLYTIPVMILGVGVYGLVIGSVTSIFEKSRKRKEQAEQKIRDLNLYMKHYNIPDRIQQSALSYYSHLRDKKFADDENHIISFLPNALQSELKTYVNMKLIKNAKIFGKCSQSCLKDIASRLEQHFYSPGQNIINIGEIGDQMYIVAHGLVEVINTDAEKVASLHEGQAFGEIALIEKTTRAANVRARTYCDLYSLKREDFDELVDKYPELSESIREHMGEHLPPDIHSKKDIKSYKLAS